LSPAAEVPEAASHFRFLGRTGRSRSKLDSPRMTPSGLRRSLGFHPQFLDDRPPLPGIGSEQSAEHLWRLSLPLENVQSEIDKL